MPAETFDGIPVSGVIENQHDRIVHPKTEQDPVVISGISGRLPESSNLEEFYQHLMNGEDMVTSDDRRWPPGLNGLPTRSGKLKDLDKFDAEFFGVHPKQANKMDPQLRLLLEVTYEAILDSGSNPSSIRGSNTGVFIGCSSSDAHEGLTTRMGDIVGYEMTGCNRAMLSNRLSFFFDFKGPSFTLDTACSSSLLALDQALLSLRSGRCDSAVVAGCSVCLKPATSMQFHKLGMLSPAGACKSFDASGAGYCRSEAVVCVYLQRQAQANRVYTTLVHSKTNSDGNKEQGITFPSGAMQKQLLQELYKEACIDPRQVAYVEAHGTGTKVGDPQEISAIAEVFCGEGRQGPLLIGSTKSNMGHPEAASGLAALAKVILSMERGVIPANLHYKNPNPDITALTDGRLQVVHEATSWMGGYVGINSFGFGGSNVHVLLKSNGKKTLLTNPDADVQRLFTYSGRTEEGLSSLLTEVHQKCGDLELQALLQQTSTSLQPFRGFTVLNTQGQHTPHTQKSPLEQRPVWFVFSGMGTQWPGMGRQMMAVHTFRQSIQRSTAVLQPHGLDLYDMIMSGDVNTFDNTLNAFVGIASIQVALVDVLHSLGIQPSGIVGHSVGELGCAYADGGLTAEEAVLAAYWRGRCVLEADLPPGGMAAVGLTWQAAIDRCPEGVVPACHNAKETVTVSGPLAAVKDFVNQLKSEGIFAKEVNSSGVAFHSYFMKETAGALKQALSKVIQTNRPRSPKWISSSIPQSQWHQDLARYSSPEYHVNNLVSPVLFQEALEHVPGNAVVVEIAPHCLLQAVLKRSLGAECAFVGLMKRNCADNVEYFHTNLGKLFLAGVDFNPLKLYRPVHLPVSSGTSMLSPLIKWDHSMSWDVPSYEDFSAGSGGANSGCVFNVDISPESEDNYLAHHVIDGRVLFPGTGYLVLVWQTLAEMEGVSHEDMAVSFTDVKIHRATILTTEEKVKFEVNISKGSGQFEILESGSIAMSGYVMKPADPVLESPVHDFPDHIHSERDDTWLPLTAEDVYKELRLRGYHYGEHFQGIVSASNKGDCGELKWTGNWVTYLDTMLQSLVLNEGTDLKLPTRIQALRIDPRVHGEKVIDKFFTQMRVDRTLNTCTAGGVEIIGLHMSTAPRRLGQQSAPITENVCFVPYNDSNAEISELSEYIHSCETAVEKGLHQILSNGIKDQLRNVDMLRKFQMKISANLRESKEKTYLTTQGQSVANDESFLQLIEEVFKLKHDDKFCVGVTNLLQSKQTELNNDKLLGCIFASKYLKSCLDVVVENTSGNRLKICEFTASKGQMYSMVIPMMNSQPLLEIDYIVVDKAFDSVEQEHIEAIGASAVELNTKGNVPNSIINSDLVLMNQTVPFRKETLKDLIITMLPCVKDNSFLLIKCPTDNFEMLSVLSEIEGSEFISGEFCNREDVTSVLTNSGFQIVAQKFDGLMNTLFLCKKYTAKEYKILDVSSLDYSWVEEVKQSMSDVSGDVILSVSGSQATGVVGMVNCLRKELGGENIRCVVNTSDHSIPESALRSQLDLGLVMNVYIDGVWGSYRHLPFTQDLNLKTISTEHAYVNVTTKGDLSSLKWIESALKYQPPEDSTHQAVCTVNYTALNFRDIMLATGKLSADAIPGDLSREDCLLGMEFSGCHPQGHRVMGLLPAKGLSTSVAVSSRFLWQVPSYWTLEEAATIPVVYTTAYYALVVRARVKHGDKVLIHSGSGGVGQAAISVALSYGCKVFTTVGSPEKKQYLQQRFPQLTDNCFANSRDKAFEWHILQQTNGKGVDVILNSLSEDKLQASVRILAQHGRFLEIGKFDLSNNTALGMSVFLKNITFHGVLLDSLFDEGNPEWGEVSDLLKEGIQKGVVKPLRTTVYDKADIEGAFRFMAQGKHIGKVVIKIREETSNIETTNKFSIPAVPRSYCDRTKSYIITGGLGGFGLELTDWLITRGASHIILTSRSGVTNGYQSRCLRKWRERGVEVVVSRKDVSHLKECEELVKIAQDMAPLGGLFHLAMVLKDAMMENQTTDMFKAVCQPKALGTLNLDKITRLHCSNSLDWFVVFSSVSCGRGNAGQSNYGFANSYMERICEQRKRDNLPGLAIQWGAIGDVGVVMKTLGDNTTVVGGTLPQHMHSCLHTLDRFLSQSNPVVSSFVKAENSTNEQRRDGGKHSVVDAVAHILGMKDSTAVNPDTTLGDFGLDSLMGVEVKQLLERELNLVLQIKEVRLLSINKLTQLETRGAPSEETNSSGSHNKGVSEDTVSSVHNKNTSKGCLVPKDNIVQLKAPGNDGSSPLFLIHPIEGHIDLLRDMAGFVEGAVYGIQCTEDTPLGSIQELATYYIQLIKQISPVGPYQLAGYSFGAAVAIEAALQLQQNKEEVASLALLDGSHCSVAAHTKQHKSRKAVDSMSEVEGQAEVLCAFTNNFVETDYPKLYNELLKYPDLGGRVEHVSEYLMNHGRHTDKGEIAAAAYLFYKKILAADVYRPTGVVSADVNVTLVKASQGQLEMAKVGEDYGLNKICACPVSIHTVAGDHSSFLQGQSAQQVADIVNMISKKRHRE